MVKVVEFGSLMPEAESRRAGQIGIHVIILLATNLGTSDLRASEPQNLRTTDLDKQLAILALHSPPHTDYNASELVERVYLNTYESVIRLS